MEDRLNERQLQRIIAEVDQLSTSRQQDLDREQVREILQELNLAPDLLEEALIQLHRRDALVVQQRRQRQWLLGIALALVLLGGGLAFWWRQSQQTLEQVAVQQSRITPVQDDGGNLTTVSRQPNTELVYRVTLKQAPIGKQLSLTCNWMDATDQVMHQNRYQTKEITTSVWPTYCRYTLGPAATPGKWRVEMRLGDRQISQTAFEVK